FTPVRPCRASLYPLALHAGMRIMSYAAAKKRTKPYTKIVEELPQNEESDGAVGAAGARPGSSLLCIGEQPSGRQRADNRVGGQSRARCRCLLVTDSPRSLQEKLPVKLPTSLRSNFKGSDCHIADWGFSSWLSSG